MRHSWMKNENGWVVCRCGLVKHWAEAGTFYTRPDSSELLVSAGPCKRGESKPGIFKETK